ncbi:MAG TPA: hypothetical protein VGQ09_23000 [Chitinophagaceae bacterium]|jgi:hypothetical protein|nr:hypothetical protein [Chitinophagaceae bacterium]
MILGIIISMVGLYLLSGFLFVIPFVIKGVTVIDPDGAQGTKWGFRLIIIPGTIVFWPLLLKKWLRASKKENHD